ncbi:MAG TPA: hypothetical protein VGM83_09140 [Devosiaceae bacterium]|jgi:hypothetical protein
MRRLPGVYALHAGLRLRWYSLASGRLLLRHWQWFVLAGLIVPGIPFVSLLAAPAQLLGGIFTPGHETWATLVSILVVQAFALLWLAPQRETLAGGDFAHYLAALPIPDGVRRAVDLTLLAVADIPILLVCGMAFVQALGAGAVSICAALAVLVITIPAMQMLLLHWRPLVIVSVLIADLLLAMSPTTPALVAAALAFAILAIIIPGRIQRLAFSLPQARKLSTDLSPTHRLAPSLHIQLQVLAQRPLATAPRLLLALGLAVAGDALIEAFHFDTRSMPVAIVALAIAALVLSGFYRLLRDAHAPMLTFLASLPLRPNHWLVRDVAFVLLLGLVPLALLIAALGLHDLSTPLTLTLLAGTYLVLLSVLRLPLAWGGRLAPIFGALIAAGWASTAIAAVVR